MHLICSVSSSATQRKQLMRAVVREAECRLNSIVVTIHTAIVQYVLQCAVVRHDKVRGRTYHTNVRLIVAVKT